MEDEDHALTDFLNQRLPALGLDADTYAPYLLPLLSEQQQDEEEWESVMELLQASSESHSDDNDAFQALRTDIEHAWQQHQEGMIKVKHQKDRQRHADMEQKLAEEHRVAAAEALAEVERKKAQSTTVAAPVDDAAKRALLSRFGYEDNEEDNAQGEDAAPVLNNRQVAEQTKQEEQQALRGQSVQTKKEEQQKTAQAKREKANLKEERRKKATKGERKR